MNAVVIRFRKACSTAATMRTRCAEAVHLHDNQDPIGLRANISANATPIKAVPNNAYIHHILQAQLHGVISSPIMVPTPQCAGPGVPQLMLHADGISLRTQQKCMVTQHARWSAQAMTDHESKHSEHTAHRKSHARRMAEQTAHGEHSS
jgi:hypothetical protein